MAYKYFANRVHTSFTAQHDAIRDLLLAAGWTHTSDSPQPTYSVLKSDGESSNGVFQYVQIFITSGGVNWGLNWNTTTHLFLNPNALLARVWSATHTCFCYANKDAFFIATITAVNAMTITSAGKATPPSGGFSTQTTATFTTGTNVVISVADLTGFNVGYRYAAYDLVNNKRQGFLCTAKSGSSGAGTITADTTTCGIMAIGTYVGRHLFPYWNQNSSFGWGALVNPHPLNGSVYPLYSGYNTGFISRVIASVGTYPYQIVDSFDYESAYQGDRRLFDMDWIAGYGGNPAFFARMGTSSFIKTGSQWLSNINMGCAVSLLQKDAQGLGVQVSGRTSTGANTATLFNDTGATWTVNQWAGKVLICTSGTESGQIAMIVSNTATQLTVVAMYLIPTACTYVICDEGYRMFVDTYSTTACLFFREGV